MYRTMKIDIGIGSCRASPLERTSGVSGATVYGTFSSSDEIDFAAEGEVKIGIRKGTLDDSFERLKHRPIEGWMTPDFATAA